MAFLIVNMHGYTLPSKLPFATENVKKPTSRLIRFHSQAVQMCSPRVTPFVPGQSVTVGKRHYSHAYLL